jgi:hypothetical protein
MVEQVKPFGQAVVQCINTTSIMIDGLSAPWHFSYPRQVIKQPIFHFAKRA